MRLRVRQTSGAWWFVTVLVIGATLLVAASTLIYMKFLHRSDIIVGTAGVTGVYRPLGGSICRLFNLDTPRHGMRCANAISPGPDGTIESLRGGKFDIGVVPSDILLDAVSGRGHFAKRRPITGLRLLFVGPQDVFTVVARRNSGIRIVGDLHGKRVNFGKPSSWQREIMERFTTALGFTRHD